MGYDIQMQFDSPADPATFRAAIESADGIRAWWSARTTLADGRLEVLFPDQARPFEFAVEGDGARVAWRTLEYPMWWAGTSVTFDIAPNPEGPGTRVLFGHRDYAADNPVIPIVTFVWAQILVRLKAYAETGTSQPFFDW